MAFYFFATKPRCPEGAKLKPTSPPVCPYPGLRPFEPSDEKFFFGREAQIDAILQQLENHHFVAVVGSSGSGKSSLIRAGVLPAVQQGFLLGTSNWRTMTIIPGRDPYGVLAAKMCAEALPKASAVAEVQSKLELTDTGLVDVLSTYGVAADTNVMIVVDQFEEIFGFRRLDAPGTPEAMRWRDAAGAFVRMLLHCAETHPRVWVILTMRSDFIGYCEAFLGLPEAVSRSQFLVPRLSRSQMEKAVQRPGEVADPRFTVDAELVNQIVNDAGDRPDQLPLMQHALMRTWQRALQRMPENGGLELRINDYMDVGKIDEALSRHVESAWAELKNDERRQFITRRLFLLLCDVAPDDQKITRRRPTVGEVLQVTGASLSEVTSIVHVFRKGDRSFLKYEPADEPLRATSQLDIPHEALYRQWTRWKAEWLPNERAAVDDLRILARMGNTDAHLMRGRDLARFSCWKSQFGKDRALLQAWAQRYLHKDVDAALGFLARSEARRTRMITYAVSAAVLLLAASLQWIDQSKEQARRKAEENARQDELMAAKDREERVNQYLRVIGFSSTFGTLPQEIEALWRLAETPINQQPVRLATIERWFQTEESVTKPLNNDGRGLHAAVVLNSRLRADQMSHAEILLDRLVGVLNGLVTSAEQEWSNVQKSETRQSPDVAPRIQTALTSGPPAREGPKSEWSRFAQLGDAFSAIAPLLNPEQTRRAALAIADALARLKIPPSAESLPIARPRPTAVQGRLRPTFFPRSGEPRGFSSVAFAPLSSSIVALSKRLAATPAAEVGARLRGGMRESDELIRRGRAAGSIPDVSLEQERQIQIVRALAAVALQFDSATALQTAGDLAAWLKEKGAANPALRSALCESLAVCAGKIEPTTAHGLVLETAQGLATELSQPPRGTGEMRAQLALSLAQLLPFIHPAERAVLTAQATEALIRTIAVAPAAGRLSPIPRAEINALRTFADHVDPSQAQAALEALRQSWTAIIRNPFARSMLAGAVDRFAAKLPPEDAMRMAMEFLDRFRSDSSSANETSPWKGPSFRSLIASLKPADADQLAAAVIEIVQAKPNNTATTAPSDLIVALASAAPLIRAGDAANTVQLLRRQLAAKNFENAQALETVEAGILRLADRLSPPEVASTLDGVVGHLIDASEADPDRLRTHQNIVAGLSPKVELAQRDTIARSLIGALLNPAEDDEDRLRVLTETAVTLLGQLPAEQRKGLAADTARATLAALANPDAGRAPYFVELLAAQLQGQDAADVNRVVAEIAPDIIGLLVKANDPDSEWDAEYQLPLIMALGHISKVGTSQLRLLAIAELLAHTTVELSYEEGDASEEAKLLTALANQLSVPELVEVLKWPFCVGPPQTVVLSVLEKKTGHRFDGDPWLVVMAASPLGIRDIASPASRPSIPKILEQLMAMRSGSGMKAKRT